MSIKYEPHPISLLYPPRDEAKNHSLELSILKIGQQMPLLVMTEGKKVWVIDGVQRLGILEKHKLPIKTVEYQGERTESAILQAVVAANVTRGMNDSQQAMLAFEAIDYAGKDTTVEAVAEMFGVSRRYVFEAQKLALRAPKMVQRVKLGELTISQAKNELARKDKAREWKKVATRADSQPGKLDILTGNSAKVLKKRPDESVDLVFADPPYGIGDDYHGFNDKLTGDELIAQIEPVMAQCVRLLKPTGSVWLMMSSRYAIDTGLLLQRLGLHRQEMIIWAESFGPHNSKFHTDCYRVVHFYTKHATDFTFNWDDVRTYIPSWRNENDDDRGVEVGKLPPNVWGCWTDKKVARVPDNAKERIPKGRIKAPNQLPVRLLERIVLLASNPDQTVLDPYHGTGTTAVACQLHQRHYIGCELDPEVAEASRGWIKARVALFKENA